MKQYDELVDWYAINRDPEIGIRDVSRFAARLARGSTFLDLGCGDGFPISQFLLEAGFTLYGIDSSARMIERFSEKFPDVPVECSDLRQSNFFSMTFDAIVAYGLMFHFTQDDQGMVIAKVSEHLREGGMLLFNAGAESGKTVSVMDGVEVPHWSMNSGQYAEVLDKNGLTLLSNYADEQAGTHVYIAEKKTTGS
jgi:2-polyprenyl-3-methyl-5-hydroxy-6-metoxy-1,4-benzoquinol methylase